MEPTDAELIAAVLGGDSASFEPLIRKYQPRVFATARRYARRESEVEDIVQEVFIKAYVNIKSFDTARRFSPWIYRIAHNEFVNNIKKRQKERDNVSIFDFDTLFPHLIAKETADDGFNKAEVKRMLERSLDTLSEKYKEPLVLYYFEDMDYREIADILHIPISTVGVRLQRGRMMLKKIVQE